MADTSADTDDSRQKSGVDASNTHDDGADDSDGRSRTSKYTYRSEIDAERFIKHIGGRVSTRFYPSRCEKSAAHSVGKE